MHAIGYAASRSLDSICTGCMHYAFECSIDGRGVSTFIRDVVSSNSLGSCKIAVCGTRAFMRLFLSSVVDRPMRLLRPLSLS